MGTSGFMYFSHQKASLYTTISCKYEIHLLLIIVLILCFPGVHIVYFVGIFLVYVIFLEVDNLASSRFSLILIKKNFNFLSFLSLEGHTRGIWRFPG